MTKTFLAWIALGCLSCGGEVDLGGAGGSGAAGGGGGSSGSGGSGGSGACGSAGCAGSGAGGAGAVAGGGGTGGATPSACSTLKRTGDPVKISSDDESSRPSLVRTGAGAAVVYQRPSSPGAQVRHASWADPWTGAWSAPAVSPNTLDGLAMGGDFAVRASRGAIAGSVAVLHTASDNACMTLSRPIPDQASLAGFPCPPPLFTFGPAPVALAAGAALPTGEQSYLTASLTGYGSPAPASNYQLNVYRVALPTGAPPGTVGPVFDALGCATAVMHARAWYSPTAGYLLAYTTSRPFLGCLNDLYADGPPNRLQIVSLGKTGDSAMQPKLVHEVVEPHAILSLDVAVRSDGGAWVVFQASATGGELDPPGPIRTFAVDAAGQPTTQVKAVVEASGLGAYQPAEFGVTTLGDRLVLAGSWQNTDCDAVWCPGLWFYLVDEASADKPPPLHVGYPSSVMIGSPMSLLASPDGSRLIAAYSDWTGNPTDVWAERYECVP